MANLSIRKLEPSIYKKLRQRASKYGISMEEEVRRIIYTAVAAPEKISVVFEKYFGVENGIDLDLDQLLQRAPHRPLDFDK